MTLAARVLAYAWHWVGLYLYLDLERGAAALAGFVALVSSLLATLVCYPEIALAPDAPTFAQHIGLLLLVIAGSAVWALLLWGLVRLWVKYCY
ncbi:MAG: hypothetical protein LAO55_23550 [Acidobacteriia bacterium]|nr:hypothetical protein [Terriglobia bacterium]